MGNLEIGLMLNVLKAELEVENNLFWVWSIIKMGCGAAAAEGIFKLHTSLSKRLLF
jgi:hypothetical protein